MAQPLSFLIELFDKMSGPADKISGATDHLGESIEKVHHKLGGLESGWTKFNEKLELGKKGFEAASWAGEKIVGVLEAIGENQATQGIFKDILGDEEGEGVLKWLGKIRTSTAFTRDQLEGLAQPLAEFFKGDDLKNVIVAGLDVGRGSIERTTMALDAFAKVASTGKISSRAFKTLGLSGPEFKALGAGDAGEASVTVDRLLSMIAAKSGGQLGGRSLQASDTVAGRLNQLKGAPQELWEKLADSPALPKITAAIAKLTDSLTSERTIGAFAGIIEKLGSKLPAAIERAPEVIDHIVVGFEHLAAIVEKVWGIWDAGGGVIDRSADKLGVFAYTIPGQIIGALLQLGDWVTGGWTSKIATGIVDGLTAEFSFITDAFKKLGEAAWDGFKWGLNAPGRAAGAVEDWADGIIGSVRSTLQIQSPSKVMERLGRYTAEGFANGLDSGGMGAFSSAFAVDDVATSSRFNRGAGGISISFGDIIVHGGGKDAGEIGDMLEQRVRDTVRDLLDEYGLEAGVD